MNIENGLNIRFDIALKSASEREFYQNLYSYFDFIYKTPELFSIFEKSGEEYSKQHFEIWKKKSMTDLEADEASAKTTKLEQFNLYAVGATINVRIYLPLDDYRKTGESDRDQDPVAVILMRGIEYARGLKKWEEKNLKSYNNWFDGKRSYYESVLRRFHLLFLEEITKLKPAEKTLPEIKFDSENSILHINDKKVKITMKNDKPVDHFILEYIFENKEGPKSKSFYSEILEEKFPRENFNQRSLRRACESTNKKVATQANISNFLIFESGKSGSVHINPEYL